MELTANRANRLVLPALAFILGGILMAALWIIYINLHGSTSVDQQGLLFERSTLFWGSMLSGPPTLLVVFGLLLLYPRLAGGASRMARVGFWMAIIAMLVPALVDLLMRFIGPPFLLPVVGLGLVLLALGHRRSGALPLLARVVLTVMGILLLASMLWWLLPLPEFDRLNGYRFYGITAHLLFGLGWVALGVILLRERDSA